MIFTNSNYIFAFSHRKDGNMSFFYGDTSVSLCNRQVFLGNLGLDYRDLVCARQVHGSSIEIVEDAQRGRGALSSEDALWGKDVLVTQTPHLPLAVFTADCLSIFLFSPQGPTIALVHAGWRGTRDEIVKKTVIFMEYHLGVNPKTLQAIFGPAIRPCCYEVSAEFQGFFSYGLINRGNRFFLDLAEVNLQQLLEAGVNKDNIKDVQNCTFCQGDYFSFRREGLSSGRIISVGMLR